MSTGRLGAGDTAIQPTILNAKGDLLTATAGDTPARLAAGNSGETLVADSSTATGLAYREDYAAGKNKIINGDFNINQRAFSSTTTDNVYMFDRFKNRITGDGTATFTAETFTPGAAPVSGYEGKNFIQIVTASQTSSAVRTLLAQPIESVRTLAGETVTLSFWAKANSGTPNIAGYLGQSFGSGGSAGVDYPLGLVAISTSWARYSFTTTLSSLSGKTIGTNDQLILNLCVSAGSDLDTPFSSIGIQNNTFQIWGVQLESGSVATAFQTATGTLAGELAACQRYYYRQTATTNQTLAIGSLPTTSIAVGFSTMPVTMRTAPTFAATAGNTFNAVYGANTTTAASSIAGDVPSISTSSWYITMGSAVFTTGGAARISAVSGSTYLEFSAEL
jgi:hypothetical protein